MVQQIDEPMRQMQSAPPGVAESPEVRALDALLGSLQLVDGQIEGDADPLGRLERIKAVVAAASLRVTRAFAESQTARQRAAGLRREHLGRGVGDQVALACGLTPAQGAARVRLAAALVQLPQAERLLERGNITEWAATILVRETAHLTAADRAEVDRRLCAEREGQPPAATRLSPRRLANRARGIGAELDVAAAVRRASQAKQDRAVWIRPAPDTMAYVTALLPVVQGVSCYAALVKAAESAKNDGDERGRSQLMADILVERLTGQASAEAVPVEIGLVMTPDALLGVSDEPARLPDGTFLPAPTARDLARREDAPRWLRRLFTDPITHVVTDLDRARRRIYGGLEARVVDARDQHCRLPRCDSLLTHRDHIQSARHGGQTTVTNGQRQCPPHNLLKELPGWTHEVTDPGPGQHEVVITTPTGHRYTSQAPPALPP